MRPHRNHRARIACRSAIRKVRSVQKELPDHGRLLAGRRIRRLLKGWLFRGKFDQLQPVAQSGKAKPEQLEEIAKVRTKRVAALKNLKESWDKWKKSFKELEDLAHTDSQLTPEDVAKEMRMKLDDKDAKLELDKAHKANARFFSRATEIYNDISRDRKADSTLIKQTETWVSQIEKWPTAKT